MVRQLRYDACPTTDPRPDCLARSQPRHLLTTELPLAGLSGKPGLYAPHHDRLAFAPQEALQLIQANLRSFVGQTGFEELCRQWVSERAQAGALPLSQTVVGSHWSRSVQVDIVAINWQSHAILLGECKWGADEVDRQVVRELIEQKAPKLLQDLPGKGEGWSVHYAFFARRGFTVEARAEAGRLRRAPMTSSRCSSHFGHGSGEPNGAPPLRCGGAPGALWRLPSRG